MAGIIAAVLLALAAPVAQAAPAPPAFAPGPCPQLPAPSAAMSSAHCGSLTVPENRTVDNGNVPPQPASQRAVVTSIIPTLLLAGGFDTAVPVRWANLAAQTLSSSTVAVIPGVGHFVLPESPCAQSVAVSFLANPNAPDTGCVAGLRPPPFR